MAAAAEERGVPAREDGSGDARGRREGGGVPGRGVGGAGGGGGAQVPHDGSRRVVDQEGEKKKKSDICPL